MKEQRREKRIDKEDKIVLGLVTGGPLGGSKEPYYSLTRDISPGGVRVMTDAPVPVGSVIRIEIALARVQKIVKAKGLVRWVGLVRDEDICEMGIEFTEIGPESIGAILEFVYSRDTARGQGRAPRNPEGER